MPDIGVSKPVASKLSVQSVALEADSETQQYVDMNAGSTAHSEEGIEKVRKMIEEENNK